jgi:APA family basic amino acid/polyamine antiporter
VAHYHAESSASGLRKALGARDLTVLGVAAIIGAGIFVLPGVGVARGGPGGLVLGFVFAGIVSTFAALSYAELSAMMPISGSAYAYAYTSVGEMLAWLVGWNLVLEYALGNVAVAVGWGGSLASLLAGFGITIPLQLLNPPGVVDPTTGVVGVFNLPAFLIVMLITAVLVRGVRESARMATGLVALKLFAVLFIIFFGALYVNPANWNPWYPFGILAFMGTGALVFFAYIGFDAVSTAAEETKNPGRDLPIGIIGSLIICTILYIIVALVITGITPWQGIANDPAPAANAFHLAGLNAASVVIAVASVIGITGVLLVFQLGMPRIFMTMARDGLLPRGMATVHPTYQTPYWTTIFCSIVVAAFSAFTPIAAAAELVNIGTLFAFFIVTLAVVLLRRTMPDAHRPFRVPGSPYVPIIGMVLIVSLMASLPVITLIRFFAWSGLGLMIYGFYGARRSRLHGQPNAPRSVVLEEPAPGGAGARAAGAAAAAYRRE